MKICCISDLHGHFPEIPECDLLFLAGDYCPITKRQFIWFQKEFAPWLKKVREKGVEIVGIAGNHDWMFQREVHLIPKMEWHYLQDQYLEIMGLKIWGTPWQPVFYDWAFNAEEKELERKWNLIPEDIDVIIVHGPPNGFGDFYINKAFPYNQTHLGSLSLTRRVQEIKPKLVVCGHIHMAHGVYNLDETKIVNASYVDDEYKPCFQPILLDL